MHSLNSGHLAISIMEFGPKGWQFPEACRAVRQERDFRTSAQHVATPQRLGPTSMRSPTPLSLFGHAGLASASGRAAASRGHLSSTKAGRESRPSRSQSLAHCVGQALLCLAVGPLSNGHFGLDVCSGRQFGNKPGIIIGNPFPDYLGRHDKGQLLQELPEEEPGEAREGEGRADKARRGVPPCRSVSEGRREWAHELYTLQPMPQPLEAVPEGGSDGHWESAGGDERGGGPSLGKIQSQAGAQSETASASAMNTGRRSNTMR